MVAIHKKPDYYKFMGKSEKLVRIHNSGARSRAPENLVKSQKVQGDMVKTGKIVTDQVSINHRAENQASENAVSQVKSDK